ncbi:hypothetical protein M9H77_02197 [Catharanthus roseus]|uniref:Uncharacterized protein n=1 Tax=Catharanthus roseus TaxID=4058 RepID=A0ACC0C7U6_CATRO|nr:hypothetical protein M9H77_02197 [Catharanthus roseus]
MDYTWSNSSWQGIKDMRKQEDYQFKLAKDMHNFNIVVAMESMLMVEATTDIETSFVEEMTVMETSLKGVRNFSSNAKSYGHTSYDDYKGHERVNVKYIEHSPFDCYDFGDHSYGEEFTMRACTMKMSMRGKIKMNILSIPNAGR